jgi:O-antigen ligase
MTAKNYLLTLRAGVIASLAIFFFIFNDFLFPYITSKQLSFNILMEALLVVWVLLILKYPACRPKKSWITLGLLAYFLVIGASCIPSVNFNLSFWGNTERMLGFFHLFHFFLLYLFIITAFKKKEDWQWLFGASVLTGSLITLYGLSTNYPASTIGNAAYVAGLMIFNIYFCLWLFFSFKDWTWRLLTLPFLVLVIVGFVKADISGAQAGLGVSMIVFLFLASIWSKSVKQKIAGVSLTAVIITSIVLLFMYRQNPIFDNNFVGKALRDFSSSNPTLQTRLISWKAAAEDFHNHPWLGVGFGNYGVIFDKGFDPKFYNYSRTESYFDRAHNNLIEIASTTGVIGLVVYLSIFVAVIYYLAKARKSGRLDRWTGSIFGALFVGYFIQNLAVFDSLVTYVSLMFTLGFVYWLAQPQAGTEAEIEAAVALDPDREMLWAALLSIVMMVCIYILNGRAIAMLQNSIKAYALLSNGASDLNNGNIEQGRTEVDDAQTLYKKTFDYNSGLESDVRVYFVNILLANPNIFTKLAPENAQNLFDFAVSQLDINAAYDPEASMTQTQLAQLFYIGARVFGQDRQKFANYTGWGLDAIDTAIKASPRRTPLHMIRAELLLLSGQEDEAVKTLQYAISLNTDYPDPYCQLAEDYYFMKDYDQAYGTLGACLDHGGASLVHSVSMLNDAGTATSSSPEFLLKVYEALGAVKQDAPSYAKAAQQAAKMGLKQRAIDDANQAAKIDPTLQPSVDAFIQGLK